MQYNLHMLFMADHPHAAHMEVRHPEVKQAEQETASIVEQAGGGSRGENENGIVGRERQAQASTQ